MLQTDVTTVGGGSSVDVVHYGDYIRWL